VGICVVVFRCLGSCVSGGFPLPLATSVEAVICAEIETLSTQPDHIIDEEDRIYIDETANGNEIVRTRTSRALHQRRRSFLCGSEAQANIAETLQSGEVDEKC
jgi:hypothetical protein